MANEIMSVLGTDAIEALLKARRVEAWTEMQVLVPYGMHRELLHTLEDRGLVIVNGHRNEPKLKLTARGYNVAQQLKEEAE